MKSLKQQTSKHLDLSKEVSERLPDSFFDTLYSDFYSGIYTRDYNEEYAEDCKERYSDSFESGNMKFCLAWCSDKKCYYIQITTPLEANFVAINIPGNLTRAKVYFELAKIFESYGKKMAEIRTLLSKSMEDEKTILASLPESSSQAITISIVQKFTEKQIQQTA